MNRKFISLLLVFVMVFSNAASVFAISDSEHEVIDSNALLIGDYLFELDNSADSFTLESFMKAVRSLEDDEKNAVYYKAADGHWYELIADQDMKSKVAYSSIDNDITVKNGVKNNTDPTVLAASDLVYSPTKFVEGSVPGTFDTEISISIKTYNNAKFAENINGNIDVVSSASLVKTGPEGTNLKISRVDDKTIKVKLIGTAKNHQSIINKTEGSGVHQKDYNKNGIFGDIKFLMLKEFFTGVTSVEENGQYVVLDVVYNDGAMASNDIVHDTKSKMVTIENVDYGVLVLNQGNINDYNFTINGATLNPTKVNDSGTVVKFEMNRNEVAAIKVIDKNNNNRVDTINIGTGKENFTGVIENQDPDRILVSGPVSVFDYHLVDYDKNGVIRSTLEKTTFDTDNEGKTPVDTSVPTMTFEKVRTPLGENIVINVADPSSLKSKKWLSNLYDVLKNYETSASSRQPLLFNVDNGAGKVTILANSTPIEDRNGKHKIVLKSNGFNDVHMEFELVEPAGALHLSPNFNWWAENELLFELQDFNYAVTNPIYEVYLDGNKLEGDCKDYHVVSNLVRLENNVVPKLTVGEHTLVIKAHGFEDYKRTFTLETAPNGAKNPTIGSPDDSAEKKTSSVDVVTAASGAVGGGSGSGGSGGSGGGLAIRANVIYNFDHLVNAFVLKDLDMNTPYSDKLINWWHSFTKDAIIKDGSKVLVEYQYYKNEVGLNGKFKTFAQLHATMPAKNPEPSEYMAMGYKKPDGLYLNRPYNVKNMLHDAKMGEIYAFGEVTATPAPSIAVQGDVKYGQDLVIKYTGSKGDDWADNLVSVKINSNYLKSEIDKVNDTITFKASDNSIGTGENVLKFVSEGFTSVELRVNLVKETQQNVQVTTDADNNLIIGTFTDDFNKNLNGVYLGAKGLFTDEAVGGNSGSYHLVGNQIVLRSKIFGTNADQYAMDKQHVLKVRANGYNDFALNIVPQSQGNGSVDPADVPAYVVLNSENKYRSNEDVKITVEDSGNSDYKGAIQEIYVDGNKLEASKYGYSFNDLVIKGEVFANTKAYEVKLVARDYKDKTLAVTINDSAMVVPSHVKFDEDGQTVVFGNSMELFFGDSFTPADYYKAITKIVIGSTEFDVTSPVKTFDISSKVKIGLNTITVKATNYVDKVYTVTMTKADAPVKVYKEKNKSDDKTVVLNKPEDLKFDMGHYTNDIYIENVKAVKLNGTPLASDKYTLTKASSSNELIIKSENLTPGNDHTIVIEAEGYNDASFTVTVEALGTGKDVPVDVKIVKNELLSDEVSITFTNKPANVKIVTVDDYYEGDYEKALENGNSKIIVDGNELTITSDTITRQTIKGSYKRVLTIDLSAVSSNNISIVLKADGYKEKTFSVVIDPSYKESVPAHVQLSESNKEVSIGSSSAIKVDAYNVASTYKDAISSIEIVNSNGRVTKHRKDLNVSYDLTIDKSWLTLGDNQVTIKADNGTVYQDFTCTIKVVPMDVPSVVKLLNEEASSTIPGKTIAISSSKDVYFVVGDPSWSNEKKYIDAIQNIRINDVVVNDMTVDEFKVGFSDNKRYMIPAKYFKPGTTTNIKIEASNYQTAEFTITVNPE